LGKAAAAQTLEEAADLLASLHAQLKAAQQEAARLQGCFAADASTWRQVVAEAKSERDWAQQRVAQLEAEVGHLWGALRECRQAAEDEEAALQRR
jgi:hypothetical protein